MWFVKNRHPMTLAVVHENNTHANDSGGSMWFMERIHMQMTLVVVYEKNKHAMTLVVV